MSFAIQTEVDNRKVIVAPDGRMFRGHPRYGWVASTGRVSISFIMDDRESQWSFEGDENGQRMLGLPQGKGRKVWLFGCSNTFGYGLPVEETFAYRLQAARPDWAVRNFGITGYGTGQMLLRFLDEMKTDRPDDVILFHLHEHYPRAVASLVWVQGILKGAGAWFDVAPNGWPRVGLNVKGDLYASYVPFKGVGIDTVSSDLIYNYAVPDEWYMATVISKIMIEMRAATQRVGARFHAAHFQAADYAIGMAQATGVPTIDLSDLDRPELTLRPFDCHPNAAANAIYAERILNVIG